MSTLPPRRVVVVLDDETVRESVSRAIRTEGHRAEPFADGRLALDTLLRTPPADVVIVDRAIGGVDGLELARRLRERSPRLPIVLLTSNEQEIEALHASGFRVDDYLPKPFSIREVMARIKALIRRDASALGGPLAWEDRPLTLGPLTVDPLRLSAQWNGQDLALTVTEFFVLHGLVRRAGVVKTRDQLVQEAFPDRTAVDRPIDTYVKRVQAKFERLEPRFDALESVHGAGYRYRSGPSLKRS